MSDTTTTPTGGRIVLLLIAGIPLTMILAASWLWYFVVKGDLDLVGAIGTANHGTLLQPPRQLGDLAFTDAGGEAFAWSDVEPRWTMLMVNEGNHCDSVCENRLYMTRQIHILLGKEFNRVRRVMVTDIPPAEVSVAVPEGPLERVPENAPTDLPGFAALAHERMLLMSVEPGGVSVLASEWQADPHHWYLVDPAGWVMMQFSDELDYKSVIKDMKFLLKNSGG